MKKLFLLFLFSSVLFSSDLKIAVASNVSFVIKALIQEYNISHSHKVKVILGSSGKLTALIRNGAPYDLFLSANMKYPNALYEDKLSVKKPFVYAKGKLALFSLRQKQLKDIFLLNDVKSIAIANPKTAPYGIASLEAITNAGLLKNNQSKFIYAENISQTLQYVFVAADVGLIAKSSLYAPKMKKFKNENYYVNIDESLYTPILQGIAALNEKKSTLLFYDFMSSKKAKKILVQYGYSVE